jgi:carbon-monoxide dehydrogenase large subunit
MWTSTQIPHIVKVAMTLGLGIPESKLRIIAPRVGRRRRGDDLNPKIVDGQVVGGVIQGIAEAIYEETIYDDNGQLLTSSMTQYGIPAASEAPAVTVGRSVTPSTTNELGVKGVGETGTIASPVAVVNAVIDALSPLGITSIERPLTSERVWRTIQQAQGGEAR